MPQTRAKRGILRLAGRKIEMIKVLFICHGNICRSPMAEFIMKDMVKKLNNSWQFEIASAATSREEIGNPVYPPAKRVLSRHGISSEGKRARQITQKDYMYYDYLICMDDWNVRNCLSLFGGDYNKKIHKLLEFAGEDRDVSDPWYTGDFDKAWDDIYKGCAGLLESLKSIM